MDKAIKIPLWIKIYSAFLILTALVGGYAGYVDPYIFFPAFEAYDLKMSELPMNFLNGLWGTRNVAALLVLIAGWLLKRPQLIMAVFAFRFLVEFQDIFILAPFYNDLGTPIWAYFFGTAVFLLPEGLGAWTLYKLTSETYKGVSEPMTKAFS